LRISLLEAGAYIIDNVYGIVEFNNGCGGLLDLGMVAEAVQLRSASTSRSDNSNLVVGYNHILGEAVSYT
jgi:hypothetical protein